MLNMTVVVNKKDVIKYFIKALALICILYFIGKIINLKNIDTKMQSFLYFIDYEKLISCIEENIPVTKQINKKDGQIELKNEITINPLKYALSAQLMMMNNIKNIDDSSQDIKGKINDNENIEHAQTGISTEVLDNNVPENYSNSYNGVEVKNDTEFEITEEMLIPNVEIKNRNVIIFHTHTCESYTPTDENNYESSGEYRTTDLNYSVARVGDELEKQLSSYNFSVIHDTTYHDFPAYNGSYGRSLDTVENILNNNNQNTDIIIDIHRDAIADYSYAPTVKIGDEYASQLMFVIGTDGGGLEHPNWNQNLKFAVKVQEKANELYPGLFRPIILRNSRYNQHLARGASIIEVGATGNTLEQSITSMKYLAKVLDEVVK